MINAIDDNIFNFDETGFIMGVIATSKFVRCSDTISRTIVVQPGNDEWARAVEGVNASGWAVPPFIMLAGKFHQSNWYREVPADWKISVVDNEWKIDQLGIEWIKHFNTHRESSTKIVYGLLIFDGHSSHATPEFDQCCTSNKNNHTAQLVRGLIQRQSWSLTNQAFSQLVNGC